MKYTELKVSNREFDPALVAAFKLYWLNTIAARDELIDCLKYHYSFDTSKARFAVIDMIRLMSEQLRDELHPKLKGIQL